MSRRDEIDPKLAKHFAWSYVPADQTAALDDAQRAALEAQGAQSAIEPRLMLAPTTKDTMADQQPRLQKTEADELPGRSVP